MKWHINAMPDKDVETLHRQALDLLARYGIRILSEKARGILADNGAKVENDRVFFPTEMIQTALETAPSSFRIGARNPGRTISIGEKHPTAYAPSAGMVMVVDAENGRRPSTFEDLKNLLKLGQNSPNTAFSVPGMVYAGDLDSRPDIFHQAMMQSILLSDKPLFAVAHDKDIAADTIEMARIATEDAYPHFSMGVVDSLSPMAWDGKMLDSLMVFAEKNQPVIITACSLAGVSSHIRLGETLLQNHAEVLAGIVLAQLINPGAPVVYGNTSSIADMRSITLAIGAPECAMLSAGAVQLARHLGLPCRTGGGLTDAKDLEAQAALESTMNLLFTSGNNVDVVLHAIGAMDSFFTMGYEKWIMDEKILDRIARQQRTIVLPDDAAIQSIGNISVEGFLQHPDTFSLFRTEHFESYLEDRSPYDQWKRSGKTFLSKATAMWKKRLAAYEMPELNPAVKRELEQFVASGISRINSK